MPANVSQDRARGMFAAHLMGDALGTPCELRGCKLRPAECPDVMTDKWSYCHADRWGRTTWHPAGMGSDDFEMTASLLGVLARAGGSLPSEEQFFASYSDWATSGCDALGYNTRRLLKTSQARSVQKRRAAYDMAFATAFPTDQAKEDAQSNGCLMRASPLALLDDQATREAATRRDCFLTNPSETALAAVLSYLRVLRWCLVEPCTSGQTVRARVQEELAGTAQSLPSLRDAIRDALAMPFEREIRQSKGWILHALAVAFHFAQHDRPLAAVLGDVVRLGGDTDTNAAITGALLGARHGLAKMREDPSTAANLRMIEECTPQIERITKAGAATCKKRPREYTLEAVFDCASVLLGGRADIKAARLKD